MTADRPIVPVLNSFSKSTLVLAVAVISITTIGQFTSFKSEMSKESSGVALQSNLDEVITKPQSIIDASTKEIREQSLRVERAADKLHTSALHATEEEAPLSSGQETWASKLVYDFVMGEKIFRETAMSFQPITDKVHGGHHYERMYGQLLMPFYAGKSNMKFLEIGLGCDMSYGPGASVNVWKKLFPQAELWEAEFNAACVEKSKAEGKLDGIKTLTGDQMNITTLDRWIEESGGADFDVVIDDGGHQQCQIWTTLMKLWPSLRAGGLYFIEDLQVSRHGGYNEVESAICPKGTNVVDEMKKVIDALAHRREGGLPMDGVKFIFCQEHACVLGKHHAKGFDDRSIGGESIFYDTAMSFQPITDKVHGGHHYEIMYGNFLMPFYKAKPNMKFLEIGLGCDMRYGPGASVSIWKNLFPEADLWEAEFDAACVEKSKAEGKLDGIKILTGDQMNITTLERWIEESGGANFDVVIDDGGHQQCQIWTTLQKLWPKLNKGGLYFIEDLQVSRHGGYNKVGSALCPKGTNVVDEVNKFVDGIAHGKETQDIKFVFCQQDACVLGKH